MSSYIIAISVLGFLGITSAWLPRALRGTALPYPMIYLSFGWIFFSFLPDFWPVDPFAHPDIIEHLSELTILIALAGAGFKIDTPFNWKSWNKTWRLLGITMPLCILAVALGGWYWVGLAPAAALLLGSALAPTDPVLAGDIQVPPPNQGDENSVRFNLTAEAGLNDSLAFPFVYLAMALLVHGLKPDLWLMDWFINDVIWHLGIGILCGLGIGRFLGWLVFCLPGGTRISENREGFFALAMTLFVYGVTDMLEGYGFLAVFISAMALRATEREHCYHEHLHNFSEQIERLLLVTLMALLGGSIAQGLMSHLNWAGAMLGLALIFIIRPFTGMVALIGSGTKKSEAWLISFLGIRGMGSFYYLAYAMNQATWHEMPMLWSITAFVVVVSALTHGILAPLLMKRFESSKRTS